MPNSEKKKGPIHLVPDDPNRSGITLLQPPKRFKKGRNHWEPPHDRSPVRKDVITHLSVRRFLTILCGVWSLVKRPALTGADFASRLQSSETAARRIKYMLEHDLGMDLGFLREHEGHRGANGRYVVSDFGILNGKAVGVIAQAHQKNEPFKVPNSLLKLGFSTDNFTHFLWLLASLSPYEVTSERICRELDISKPTVARYLRIARNIFLMRIRVERFALERGGDCFYDVESWGIIRWEKLAELLKISKDELNAAKRLNKKRESIKELDYVPW